MDAKNLPRAYLQRNKIPLFIINRKQRKSYKNINRNQSKKRLSNRHKKEIHVNYEVIVV